MLLNGTPPAPAHQALLHSSRARSPRTIQRNRASIRRVRTRGGMWPKSATAGHGAHGFFTAGKYIFQRATAYRIYIYTIANPRRPHFLLKENSVIVYSIEVEVRSRLAVDGQRPGGGSLAIRTAPGGGPTLAIEPLWLRNLPKFRGGANAEFVAHSAAAMEKSPRPRVFPLRGDSQPAARTQRFVVTRYHSGVCFRRATTASRCRVASDGQMVATELAAPLSMSHLGRAGTSHVPVSLCGVVRHRRKIRTYVDSKPRLATGDYVE